MGLRRLGLLLLVLLVAATGAAAVTLIQSVFYILRNLRR
jgi:hypothetical protein